MLNLGLQKKESDEGETVHTHIHVIWLRGHEKRNIRDKKRE